MDVEMQKLVDKRKDVAVGDVWYFKGSLLYTTKWKLCIVHIKHCPWLLDTIITCEQCGKKYTQSYNELKGRYRPTIHFHAKYMYLKEVLYNRDVIINILTLLDEHLRALYY